MRRIIQWRWKSEAITLGMDEAGSGPSVILLPALSSISTREEMRPLFDRLSSRFRVVTVDWPGFGTAGRPREDWSPEILSTFLNWFLTEVVASPHAIIAAGHAATYALYQAAIGRVRSGGSSLSRQPGGGPLPTMVGGGRPWFARVRAAIDIPVFGPLLYRINVSRFVVSK